MERSPRISGLCGWCRTMSQVNWTWEGNVTDGDLGMPGSGWDKDWGGSMWIICRMALLHRESPVV